MAGVMTDHMCSPITVADQTNAKMATSLAKKKIRGFSSTLAFVTLAPIF